MNKKPSIKIHTGWYDDYPRLISIDYDDEESKPKKYALFNICIRNDNGPAEARIITVYYGDSDKELIDSIYFGDNEDKKVDLECGKKIWIDEWIRRRNGDVYQLFEIDDVENENAKVMLERVIGQIRGYDESGFNLSEKEIFGLDDLDTPLPKFYKVKQNTTEDEIKKILSGK